MERLPKFEASGGVGGDRWRDVGAVIKNRRVWNSFAT